MPFRMISELFLGFLGVTHPMKCEVCSIHSLMLLPRRFEAAMGWILREVVHPMDGFSRFRTFAKRCGEREEAAAPSHEHEMGWAKSPAVRPK